MKTYFLTIFLFIAMTGRSQKGYDIDKGHLYMYLNAEGKIEFFKTSNGKNSSVTLGFESNFNVKNLNSVNIYFEWLNPLKYKMTWQDELYDDERYKKVKDYVYMFLGQFSLISTIKTEGSDPNISPMIPLEGTQTNDNATKNTTSFELIDFIQLEMVIDYKFRGKAPSKIDSIKEADFGFTPKNKGYVNEVAKFIERDYNKIVKNKVLDLFNELELDKAKNLVELNKTEIQKLIIEKESIEKQNSNLTEFKTNIKSTDSNLKLLTEKTLDDLIKKLEDKKTNLVSLIEQFETVNNYVANSFLEENTDIGSPYVKYFRVHKMEFPQGKANKTKLNITEYVLSEHKENGKKAFTIIE
ncbi:MAG TPA: hypothetical protein PKD85_17065, partial [Saprospiraceae bacterium]|nr:hypothetical protein [Saprospiraceae bacterium]